MNAISRYSDTPHGPVHVRVHESGVPRTFVAVHGLGGSSYNWDSIAPLLDGSVVAVDLPGFGLSPPHPGDPLDAYVRVVTDLIEQQTGSVVLIGNSLGGTVAELVAAEHRLDGLVLIAPATPLPIGRAPADLAVFRRLILQGLPLAGPRYSRHLAESKTPLGQVRELMSIVAAHPSSIAPEFVVQSERLARLRRNIPWTYPSLSSAARSLALRLLRRRSFFRTIASIDAPTLLVWGNEDRLVSRASLQDLSKRRPDWTPVELDDVGHVPMLEVPSTVAGHIKDWLQRC